MSKISIILTYCENKNIFNECMHSILNQTFTEWEIIIVNPIPSSEAPSICKKYILQYPQKISYFPNSPTSPLDIENQGIKNAKSPYIFPLIGCNTIAPQCLEKLYNIIAQGIFDVIQPTAAYLSNPSQAIKLEEPNYFSMYHKNRIIHSCLFKKEDWMIFSGYNSQLEDEWKDWDFYSKFINGKKLFYQTEEILFFFRYKNQTSGKIHSRALVKKLTKNIQTQYYSQYQIYPQGTTKLINKIKLYISRLLQNKDQYGKNFRKYNLVTYPVIAKPSLVMTLLVRNEEDILEKNLQFHKAMGVDKFIVTDNMSTDNTLNIIRKYQEKGWISDVIIEQGQDYKQADWVHRMICLAEKKYHPDWIINADADEFWIPQSNNLKKELSKCTSSVLYVPIYSMLCENEEAFWNNTKKLIRKFPQKIYSKLIQEGKLSQYSQFSLSIPKCAHRLQDYKHIRIGNHKVDMIFNTPKIYSQSIQIFHYNIRGYNQFFNKMVLGGQAIANNKKYSKNVAVHWRYFWEGYQNNSLDIKDEYYKSVGKKCRKEIQEYHLYTEDDRLKVFWESMTEC